MPNTTGRNISLKNNSFSPWDEKLKVETRFLLKYVNQNKLDLPRYLYFSKTQYSTGLFYVGSWPT